MSLGGREIESSIIKKVLHIMGSSSQTFYFSVTG
jgi:hypothetical protein